MLLLRRHAHGRVETGKWLRDRKEGEGGNEMKPNNFVSRAGRRGLLRIVWGGT